MIKKIFMSELKKALAVTDKASSSSSSSEVKPKVKTEGRAKSQEPKPRAKAKAKAGAQSDDDLVLQDLQAERPRTCLEAQTSQLMLLVGGAMGQGAADD